MASESFRVLNQFIGDGSVATYTSIEHTLALAGGRSASFLVTSTNYDDDTYLTLFLENSVNGKDFQSKFIGYYTVSGVQYVEAVPIIDTHKLVYTVGGVILYPIVDTIVGAEPTAGLPNHRHARLRVQLMNGAGTAGKSARVIIDATIRGTPTSDDADAPTVRAAMPVGAPGSLTRHEQMMNEVQRLAQASEGLPHQHRAAYILTNLSSASKEHVRAVERRVQALPAHVRGAVISSVADTARRALALSGGLRRPASAKEPCCGPSPAPTPSKGPCGGGCGS
jgi:hypothetical protein